MRREVSVCEVRSAAWQHRAWAAYMYDVVKGLSQVHPNRAALLQISRASVRCGAAWRDRKPSERKTAPASCSCARRQKMTGPVWVSDPDGPGRNHQGMRFPCGDMACVSWRSQFAGVVSASSEEPLWNRRLLELKNEEEQGFPTRLATGEADPRGSPQQPHHPASPLAATHSIPS